MSLAPILPFFATPEAHLPAWLKWFDTPDNTLDGDDGWKTRHWQWRFKLPLWLCVYIGRVGWLWRNQGYGFKWSVLSISPSEPMSVKGNIEARDGDNGVEGWFLIRCKEGFQLRIVKRISFCASACFYITLGWDLKSYVQNPETFKTEPKAIFQLEPRFSHV